MNADQINRAFASTVPMPIRVGQNAKRLRERRRLTQTQLAEAMRDTAWKPIQRDISNFESGNYKTLNYDALDAYITVFNISADNLLGYSNGREIT